MISAIVKAVVSCAITCVIGTALIVSGAAAGRAWTVSQALSSASSMLKAERPDQALNELARIQPWAALYPPLARRAGCDIVRAYVRLSDLALAEELAAAMVAGIEPRPAALSLWQKAQTTPAAVISGILANTPENKTLNDWSGYDALGSELIRTNDDRFDTLVENILAEHPGSEPARKLAESLMRRKYRAR